MAKECGFKIPRTNSEWGVKTQLGLQKLLSNERMGNKVDKFEQGWNKFEPRHERNLKTLIFW